MTFHKESCLKPKVKDFSLRLWLLPIAGCLVHLMTTGQTRANGLIFVVLMEEDSIGRGMASLPFTLTGLANITMALVSGYLSNKMSFLALSFIGLVTHFLSQVACFFTNNIYLVTFFLGYLKNCGTVLLVVNIPRIITETFHDHRTTAMGIATLGYPLSGFFWTYLTNLFLENYGLQGTMLLMGAVSAHLMIGAIYMSSFSKRKNSIAEDEAVDGETDIEQMRCEDTHFPAHLQGLNTEKHETGTSGEVRMPIETRKTPKSELSCSHPNSLIMNNLNEDTLQFSEELNSSTCHRHTDPIMNVVKRKKYSETPRMYILRSVLSSGAFYLLSFNIAINLFVQNILYHVLFDYFNDKELNTESGLTVLSAHSLGGIFGRLCLSWISDKGILSSYVLNFASNFLTGILLWSIVFNTDVTALWISLFIIGICDGSVTTQNFVQFSVYFPKEKTAMALSAAKFIQGIIQLSRSPIIGLFRDVLESYDYFFWTLSGIMFLLSASWLMEWWFFDQRSTQYTRVHTNDENTP